MLPYLPSGTCEPSRSRSSVDCEAPFRQCLSLAEICHGPAHRSTLKVLVIKPVLRFIFRTAQHRFAGELSCLIVVADDR